MSIFVFTCVEQLLPTSKRTKDHDFYFVRELVLHVLLYSPEHEWFQDHVQTRQMLWIKNKFIVQFLDDAVCVFLSIYYNLCAHTQTLSE